MFGGSTPPHLADSLPLVNKLDLGGVFQLQPKEMDFCKDDLVHVVKGLADYYKFAIIDIKTHFLKLCTIT